jgi:hypothetical protein
LQINGAQIDGSGILLIPADGLNDLKIDLFKVFSMILTGWKQRELVHTGSLGMKKNK